MVQLFLFALLLMATVSVSFECDIRYGPAGTLHCITIPRYNNEYQWSTCLTDTYIRQKSGSAHQCEDRSATYCYYQCELELYNRNSGPVSSTCSCTPDEEVNTPSDELPSWCYSPPGDSCSWYEDCLEKKYPCENSDSRYAVTYAKHFCTLYDERYFVFSQRGRRWIDATRKCLQVALVPLLRQFENPSCSDIKATAFESHTCCYVAGPECSEPGTPSICDLSIFDWWRVFWTIKGAYLEEFNESLYGLFGVSRGCFNRLDKLEVGIAVIKFTVKLYLTRRFGKRSAPESYIKSSDEAAIQLAASLSKQMNWNENVLDWFAYGYDDNTTDTTTLQILLEDKRFFNLADQNYDSGKDVLNKTIESLMDKIANGQVNVHNVEYESGYIDVLTAQTCDDVKCDKGNNTIVTPPTRNVNLATTTRVCFELFVALLFVCLTSQITN